MMRRGNKQDEETLGARSACYLRPHPPIKAAAPEDRAGLTRQESNTTRVRIMLTRQHVARTPVQVLEDQDQVDGPAGVAGQSVLNVEQPAGGWLVGRVVGVTAWRLVGWLVGGGWVGG
jgi:hypothetical protein